MTIYKYTFKWDKWIFTNALVQWFLIQLFNTAYITNLKFLKA